MEGERETEMTQMIQSTSSSSSAPAVRKKGILEQVLGTRQGHKTGVGHTLSQRIHHGSTSSSSFRSEGISARVNPNVEEYLRKSYEQNLQMCESYRMMQELLVQLYPNIQFPTITHSEPYVPPVPLSPLGPPPPLDASNDDASDAANLGDNYLFYIFFLYF